MPDLKVFTCKHCKKKFVIMETANNSLLPVEFKAGEVFPSYIEFSSNKHKSHLLNCKGRQLDWDKTKWKFLKVPEYRYVFSKQEITDITQKHSQISEDEPGEVKKPKPEPTLTPESEAYKRAKNEFEAELLKEIKNNDGLPF